MSWLRRMDAPSVALRVKRFMDVSLSAGALVALGPTIAGLAALVSLTHGWPPFFTQRRPGFLGEPFMLVKLRTMTDARGPDGALLPDADRLTAVGKFLRSSSLDELPELWNVLWGDMSLVGPRPLLMRYLDRYSPRQRRRHDMPPGITGLAQISGRNGLDWPERLELDVRYVESWSLRTDIDILARTLGVVLSREGISAEGVATMNEFMGSGQQTTPTPSRSPDV